MVERLNIFFPRVSHPKKCKKKVKFVCNNELQSVGEDTCKGTKVCFPESQV